MVYLDSFLKNSPFDSLAMARAVSESGYIAGCGWVNAEQSQAAFVAIPK
jgi:hypothetical protein